MRILHYMKKENSGLARSTLELAKFEEKQGHAVCVKQPSDETPLYGVDKDMEVICVHSQMPPEHYSDRERPKFMWMHGEPLSSVGNGISMKAIVDLAPQMDAFICMRRDEHAIWNSIKRTYRIPKGVDLEKYKPIEGEIVEKMSGEPAVLYYENWRGERNPLYICVAMEMVHRKLPNARLHLVNCGDKRMADTFKALLQNNKWWTFIRTLDGPQEDVNQLLNRVDIVASGLYPLYARSIEAFAAGRGLVAPGYKEHSYPYQCDLHPRSIADAILKMWDEYGKFSFREHAEQHHDANETARQAVEVYGKYL
jgi:glycosyltransferase involved in cell wall biosynthesis